MSKFFIERPILANVIAIVTILLGAVCLYNLPVAQYPQIVPPTIQVTTNYTGASAETVAQTVGIPVEQAVNGVDLKVMEGKVTALVGDNGAGKSSLIKTISGLWEPDAGEILWEGKPIRLRSPKDSEALGITTESDVERLSDEYRRKKR